MAKKPIRATTSKSTEKLPALPPDCVAADLQYPTWDDKKNGAIPYEQKKELGVQDIDCLRFYLVAGDRSRTQAGWVLLTLHISKPGRNSRAQTDRSYGVDMSGNVVRVGKGPHVLQEVTVYFSLANIERLKKYITLHTEGLAAAGQIRDRISTRRAQGQQYRAEGRSSWRW